ncbi:MAG: type II toxin-antitoxin system VapC family toxin [Candidatus Hodarchaeota archaeon]
MPFLETDILFAFLNNKDKYHDVADKIFTEIEAGLQINIPSSVLIEMELIYKSEGREEELTGHMVNLLALKGLNPVHLTPEVILLAITLRNDYNLSFFDSHHASTALQGDGILISTDQAFKEIKGLQLISPEEFIASHMKLKE